VTDYPAAAHETALLLYEALNRQSTQMIVRATKHQIYFQIRHLL